MVEAFVNIASDYSSLIRVSRMLWISSKVPRLVLQDVKLGLVLSQDTQCFFVEERNVRNYGCSVV